MIWRQRFVITVVGRDRCQGSVVHYIFDLDSRSFQCRRRQLSCSAILKNVSLKTLMSLSQAAPKCGAVGGLKTQVIPLCKSLSCKTEALLCSFSSSYFKVLFAPMKLVPLSDRIISGRPRRLMNSCVAKSVSSVDKVSITSVCTALVTRHVKCSM